ncbi:MAG: antitoxin Xre-like helix-turn-helix domain-containing protein, partial [Dongiaceae bacterium]
MTELMEVANVLGVARPDRPLASPFELIRRIEAGLPLSALDRVMELVAPTDASFKYRVIPKASLARRRHDRKLTANESERLARIAGIWSFACDVWTDPEEARSFLFRPHAMLADRRPIDVVIESELGAQ